jgi:hypothetical protein
MDLKDLKKIETAEQYNAVCVWVDELIREASEKSLLESEYDNEYTREIGRLSRLGAIYEDNYMTFKHINAEKEPLLVRSNYEQRAGWRKHKTSKVLY